MRGLHANRSYKQGVCPPPQPGSPDGPDAGGGEEGPDLGPQTHCRRRGGGLSLATPITTGSRATPAPVAMSTIAPCATGRLTAGQA